MGVVSDDQDQGVSMIELQEEFIQHLERGGRKITLLAAIATIAGGYFAVTYFIQLVVFPYVLGITTQTVNLVDPALISVGVLSLAISLMWFYAGVRDLLFGRRIAKRIREIRALQSQAAKNFGLVAGAPGREGSPKAS